VIVFWFAAAFLVTVAQMEPGPGSAAACVFAKTVAIVCVAAAYMRCLGDQATIGKARLAGTTWLTLAIASEILVSALRHRAWFALLGSASSALRNVVMFAWVVSPLLFARVRPQDEG
jgi:hypothetical protein